MLELDQARGRILHLLSPLSSESVAVPESAGRVLAHHVTASLNLPPFNNSAMDGFAVRSADLAHASLGNPIALQLVGEIPAGYSPSLIVHPGTCVRIFTGSPLPGGADSVIMQEDTAMASAQPAKVTCSEAVKPWENVRLRGEDVKDGGTVLGAGQRLGAGSIALLAALGIRDVSVARRPMVGLVVTGNELIEAGEPFEPGKIYESNRAMLLEPLRSAGAVARNYPLVPDSLPETIRALGQAMSECDAVITTGGVSVGEYDLVKKAFEALGGKLEFWNVAIKPGKPFVFGQWRDKFLFGLPGNPVSAFVTFLLLVRPALLHLQGATNLDLPAHPGRVVEPLINRGDRRHFLRVVVDGKGDIHPAGVQASHILSSLGAANGLVDLSPGAALQAGALVTVLRWQL